MYKVLNQTTGEVLGYTDEPRYIFLAPNGSYVQTNAENAQGLAFKSIPYNLFGHEPLNPEEKLDTVILRFLDGGEIFEQQSKDITTLQTDLATADEVAISLYESLLEQQEINKTTDEAIIALYEMNS